MPCFFRRFSRSCARWKQLPLTFCSSHGCVLRRFSRSSTSLRALRRASLVILCSWQGCKPRKGLGQAVPYLTSGCFAWPYEELLGLLLEVRPFDDTCGIEIAVGRVSEL